MTEQPGEYRRPDDEIVSAVLDGEATADERARVAADPVLSARLAEFEAVRDLVATPVAPASDAQRERAIAAAKVAVRHQAPVVPLRRRGRTAEIPRFLGVAAAILFVLVGLGFLASKTGGDDSGGDDSAATAYDSGDDSAGESADILEDSAAGGRSDTFGDAPEALGDLGDVADEAALRLALVDQGSFSSAAGDAEDTTSGTSAATPSTSTAPALPEVDQGTRGDSDTCQAGIVQAQGGLAGLLAQSRVRFAGTPAVVYVYATDAAGQRVVVVSVDGCRVLASFDL